MKIKKIITKRKLLGITMALVLSQFLIACSSTSSNINSNYDSAIEDYSETENSYNDSASTQGSSTESSVIKNSNKKLIRKVSMKVETKEYDNLLIDLQKQIEDVNGYVENMSAYNQSLDYDYNDGRTAEYTIRIPSESLNLFLTKIDPSVNVIEKTESVEDVTLSYVDIDSHVKMLKEEQDRLMVFLEKANSIEEIIAIENRLSEVKYQIETMSSQLKVIDNKVNYSTLKITIIEVVELTPMKELTIWERISTGFIENLNIVKNGIIEFFIWFITHIPYIIVWGILAIIVFLIVKFSEKINKKNNYKLNRNNQSSNKVFFDRPNKENKNE